MTPEDLAFPALAREAAAVLARLLLSAAEAEGGGIQEIRLRWPLSNMSREDWARSIALWKEHGLPLLLEQPARPCPACGKDDAESLFTSLDGHPYVECLACRTWFVPLQVDYELYQRFFSHCPEARPFGDYTRTQVEDESVAASDYERFGLYYRDLLAMQPAVEGRRPAALDIGCGVGNSLAVAAELGFDTAGQEVNETAVSIARGLGRRVVFPAEMQAGEQFDVVSLWETLEHLDDPVAVLREAAGRMLPGGLLALTTPNLDSPSIRGMRADSLHILGGPAGAGHINLFTLESLEHLLARAGFETVDVCGQYTMNLYEFVAYRLGLWSGARGHLRGDDPVVRLPTHVVGLLQTMAGLIAAWEERFAMAPLVRIVAQRREARTPGIENALRERRSAALAARLEEAYGPTTATVGPALRGQAVEFIEAAQTDPAASTNDAGGLEVRGKTAGPNAYLWASLPLAVPAGAVVVARGKLFGGGFSVGLLSGEAWAATSSWTLAGHFEVVVGPVGAGEYSIVVANNAQDSSETDLTIDRLEIVPQEHDELAEGSAGPLHGSGLFGRLGKAWAAGRIRQQLASLQQDVERREADVRKRDELVAQVKRQLEESRREIEERDLEVQRRDELLQDAEQQLEASRAEIGKRNAEVQKRDVLLEELRQRANELQRLVEHGSHEVQKRDDLLQELQLQVQTSLAEIGRSEVEVQKRDDLLQELQLRTQELIALAQVRDGEVQKRDDMLQELQNQVQDSLVEIAKREAEVQKRDNLLQELQQSANELMAQVQLRDGEVQKRDGMLEEVQRKLQDSLAEITKREAEVQKRDELLQQVQQQLDGMHAQMQAKDRELKQRDELLRRTGSRPRPGGRIEPGS